MAKEIIHVTDTPKGPNEEAVKTDTQQKDEKDGTVYASGGDKLRGEEEKMLGTVKPEYKEVMKAQMDLLFSQLTELAEKDTEFEKKVLLPHKSMERCMKYCSNKAMELREPSDQEKDAARRNHVPIVTPVGETLLFSWIMEYYNMDDKEEVEKEAKRKAKQQKAEKDRKHESKKVKDAETAPEKKAEQENKAQVKTEKKKMVENKMENQLSLFDMMGGVRMVKAYKGFHKDLTCTMGRGVFQYREHEWLEEQEANCARNGFHCCYNPLDCLHYYNNFKESAYYFVYADGDIHEDGTDTRIACTRIKLEKRLSIEAFVAHALLYMAEHPYLNTNSIVANEYAYGEARNGFWLVRGKNPQCRAPIGTVVGMAQEAADSKEIISMTVYRVDGEEYRPNVVYLVDGREMAP